MDKITISRPIIVEGKYDKITLAALVDAQIIPTDGFSLFNQKEKAALLRRIAVQRFAALSSIISIL